MTETVWTAKPKVFTNWIFTEEFADLRSRGPKKALLKHLITYMLAGHLEEWVQPDLTFHSV